jgi:hypothetical protein
MQRLPLTGDGHNRVSAGGVVHTILQEKNILESVSGFVGNNRLSRSAGVAAVSQTWPWGHSKYTVKASFIPAISTTSGRLIAFLYLFVAKVAFVDATFPTDRM